jgi:hypothetical protein
MGNQNQNPAVASKVTEENIEENIKSGVVLTAEMAKKAAENIAKRNKERLVDEMEALIQKNDYIRKQALLSLKKQRRDEKAVKAYLEGLTKLAEELNEGKHDKSSYDKAHEALKKVQKESLKESAIIYDNFFKDLKKQFDGYISWDWDRD